MIEFRMPSLGADMEAGTLVQWLKKPGDPLRRGDIVAVVDTDKGAIEIEVFDDGVLDRTAVQIGQKVPVGTVLAFIRGVDEAAFAEAPAPKPVGVPIPPAAPAPTPEARIEAPGPATPPERRISPAARKAAQELHVDLSSVEGTGPGDSVTRADVERAVSARRVTPAPAPPPDRTAAMRAAIAAAMSRSKREIPHLYLATTVDMSRLLGWLAAENDKRSVETRLLPIALLLKGVAQAVVEVPDVNGFWIDSAFRPGTGVHVGCAVALRDGGLVAPALHDVDRKDLDTVMRELRDLITRARAGALRSSELSDSTITVTNLGDLGVETAFGIIYPPQVALVGLGRVAQRPWVFDGRVEPRPVMTASVSADHRAVDGRRAGLFLSAIERWVQKPETL
jgi:pyruvate dehydrogenase E2 component (dihydrolipoamide acetyltransferase)